jgi:hypothetical protein
MGSRYLIIGPTSSPNVSLGVHPVGIKRAVIRPQAMNAPMLGMIMPAKKPPNCCTLSRMFFLL